MLLASILDPQGEFLTGDPDVRPHCDGNELWTFMSSVGFRDASGQEWWTGVPFTGDGLSIPAAIRVVLGHPFCSDYIRSGALHDYYYKNWAKMFADTGSLAWEARKWVDDMFLEALLVDGVGKLRATVIYLGVRLGGWCAWRQHAREREASE